MNIPTTKSLTDGGSDMHDIIYTLQDFMLHTKNITYMLMGAGLLIYIAFWSFLTDREADHESQESHSGHKE